MTRLRIAAVTAAALAAAAMAGAQANIPRAAAVTHDIRPGPGWTVKALSDYDAGVARTPGDTPVYIYDSGRPGGTVFVTGGTHGNEIAGIMAAAVLVERGRVLQGRLIIVPHANNSAMSWVDSKWTGPNRFAIRTTSGERVFRFGMRLTNPDHQGEPDPPQTGPSGGPEVAFDNLARNLDRSYPGKQGGNLTQRVAFAVVTLIKRERVDLAFDFHEATPDSRLAMMIVANPKNIDLGAAAVLALEGKGIAMKLEPSSETFRGLSHREWGDATPAKSFLFETPSPAFDVKTAGDLVHDAAWPLARRVGVHLAAMLAVIDAFNAEAPAARQIALADVPDLDALVKAGLEGVLR